MGDRVHVYGAKIKGVNDWTYWPIKKIEEKKS